MLVSHSQLAVWRACPRKWHYIYQRGRVPLAQAEALTRGKSIHAALGALHRGEPVECTDPVERAMIDGYRARWNGDLKVERTDVPFVFGLSDGIEVNGEFDGIAIDSNGVKCVLEHKTTSEDIAPGSAYWRRVLLVDPQVTTYLHAARAMGVSHVLYDVLRKPALRKSVREDDDGFYNRIIDDIAKRPEHYYQRAVVVRLDADREDYVRDVTGTVRLMQSGHTPRNPDSCMKWGRDCEFIGVCTGEIDINDNARFQAKSSPRNTGSPAANSDIRPAGSGEVIPSGSDAETIVYRF